MRSATSDPGLGYLKAEWRREDWLLGTGKGGAVAPASSVSDGIGGRLVGRGLTRAFWGYLWGYGWPIQLIDIN